MFNVFDFVDEERKVKITFQDDTFAIGYIESVDDEEESELGEPGITLNEERGGYFGLAQSEIKSIEVLQQVIL